MIDLQDYINENYIVQGLKDYSYDEIVELIFDYIEEKLNESDINIEIKEIWLHGSRLRNTAKKSSDLDAVLFYSGSYKEDGLFNVLNDVDEDEKLYIDNILVDINTVRVNSDSEIKSYKDKSKKYDNEILNK